MSLSTALFASVSGLDATSTAIQVVGDNIANVNTPGFKERRAEFTDVLGQSISTAGGFSETGAGTRVIRVSQIFSQGSFVSTERGTDLAIEGRGFFVVNDAQGTSYTRAGMFGFDNQGFMVNNTGGRVQGFSVDPLTGLSSGATGDIVVQTTLSTPNPTSQAQLTLNLEPSQATLPLVFDPTNPTAATSSEFEFPFTVFDSQGGAHDTTVYFTPTAANAWEWNATLPDPANPGQVIVQGTGTLTFDTQGVMTAVTGNLVNFNFPGAVAPNQPITIDFGAIGDPSATSQVNSPSVRTSVIQDGFAPGTLQGVNIDQEGFIVASFSNGETLSVGRIALATFPNNEGLQAIGNNSFRESRESGQPLVGDPGTGQFGAVRANFIENSNVDLAAQFVQLILNQRAFQANTRTVSAANELLANLVQLGQ
ncbi:MAG: flagellar hook protein FlgE [Myxococcota bacterium]|nr:flagellar hook protein FlgE [Myxococcota bacterium]